MMIWDNGNIEFCGKKFSLYTKKVGGEYDDFE